LKSTSCCRHRNQQKSRVWVSIALGIRVLVDSEPMHDSVTSKLVFGVDELVSLISERITLEPAELIKTGTPGGVGFLRQTLNHLVARYLAAGHDIRVEIDRIGCLDNPVV
jgi:acylpyruvate hydrolase